MPDTSATPKFSRALINLSGIAGHFRSGLSISVGTAPLAYNVAKGSWSQYDHLVQGQYIPVDNSEGLKLGFAQIAKKILLRHGR